MLDGAATHVKANRSLCARKLTTCVIAALACICHGANGLATEAHAANRQSALVPPRNVFPFGLQHYARALRNRGGYTPLRERSSVFATTREVTNCDDAGAGSLRDTIASAVNGDTIDLSQLTCSTITLTSSYLTVLQDDLTIDGPGASSLAIDGGGVLPLFADYGNGTLSIKGLTLTNGYYYYHGTGSYGAGGCIASTASVSIENTVVSNCTIKALEAIGGGIYTLRNFTAVHSLITHNQALATGLAGSGGVRVNGDLNLSYSTVSDNRAYSSNLHSCAGSLHASANVLIENSTLSGNIANYNAAFMFSPYNNAPNAKIVNSTISGNKTPTPTSGFGGGYTSVPLTIYNSTIAFNVGAGLYAYNAPLTLQSTIIADNRSPSDLLLGGTATVSGANNLIVQAADVPQDTIRDCPKLGPLVDNGGGTLTHMLGGNSPAVDAGSNLTSAKFDQRGSGYSRVHGPLPDIGAIEWSGLPDDRLFNGGFETGCDE